ncbi:LacI family DNA-binding transcriptional regulator [Pedococcus sp. 5OH_020]|uniref:LacI family DNA-binding transcriptional regulator n=1 Tax=Pedococcus sp. 5OH_020 TaxID=2989814 RepID=UPI0022E99F29|nr:LacI family DNA-binding transcriptional regulator [Pedococcus sp. 5OH_020]
MAVTIRDVAKAAGVSPSTVSRALSLPDIVDPTTRERVMKVADHLGYRPNRAARGLITGRTGNIGLILPDLANPFFPSIVKGIQQQAHIADYQVFVADTDEDPTAELGLVRSLAKQVDGIILCSPRMKPSELREAATYCPVVLVNRKAGSIPAVAMDNADGMRQVIDHLAGLGHRRIGFVAGPRSSWSTKERLRGLRAAAAAAAVELVELGHFAPTFDGGMESVEGTLIGGVTAVIAYNDLVALGLLSALRDRGIDVPSQVSVVGIDNIQLSAMVHPALTTLDIPKEKAGRTSIDLLLHLLGDPAAGTGPARELPTELLVRHTTAPAPTTTSEPSGRRRASRL